jgi:ribose transport system ATP-binding protein
VADHPRVQFDRISKRYPGVQAVNEVTFGVAPGTIHGVVGENGAGKSTLMRILAGATTADAGVIRLDGEVVNIRSALHAQDLGIATVYQEFTLAADLTVAENVFLGRWPRGPIGLVSYRKLWDQTLHLFRSLKVAIDPRRRVGRLSVAEQQMVEIARALSLEARVLLLDEPSAVLTPNELVALFDVVRRLTRQGVSVLYISHRLDEVFELCSQVTVLRDGRHVATRPLAEVSRDMLIHDMVGRSIEEEFPRRAVQIGGAVLRVENLSSRDRFDHVSFEIRRGEVLALTGLVGSGRSSIGKALFGADRTATGQVLLGERRGPFRSPPEGQRAGIAFLPEDRKREGLLLHRPVRDNVTLSHLKSVSRLGLMRPAKERRLTRAKVAELHIRTRDDCVPVATLSGGNQQKVMIARWLQRHYPVIILDEPTRGVDVGAKVEIYRLINRMAADGSAVLLITSELPEAMGMADRIGVMARGRLMGVLDNGRREVTQEQILQLAISSRRESAA